MMGCNCHDHQPGSHIFGEGHQPLPNHIFDPNPPSYYGSWNHNFRENITNKVSVAQPGMMSGLYNPNGPLHLAPAHCTASIMTRVVTDAKIILTVNFEYVDKSLNQSIDIIPGEIYTITYVEDGELKKCSGRVSNIYKVQSLENDFIYKIKLDCSSNYANSVVVIKTDQIRYAYKYMKYAEEDTTLDRSLHRCGTTAADIVKDAYIVNAVVDANNNIISGDIESGTIENGNTVDGIAEGYNSNGHKIYVINGSTRGGIIQGGKILYGIIRSGDVNGDKNPENGITSNATVHGILMNVAIVDSEVLNGKTTNGTLIEPRLTNTIVKDAEVSGEEMITTGGITIGNLTTHGTSVGGVARGGVARGTIQGNQYIIRDGTTTGKIVTTGGILVGGTVTGGTQVGNAIINAVITGGTVTGGTTTGGVTSDGIFEQIPSAKLPVVPIITTDDSNSSSVHYGSGDNIQSNFHKEIDKRTKTIASEVHELKESLEDLKDDESGDFDTDVTNPEMDKVFDHRKD